MSILQNITVGQPKKLIKPIAFTILSNLVNIVPFMLSIETVKIIFHSFAYPDKGLDSGRLWAISAVLFAYMLVMFWAEKPAYRHSYRDAYDISAAGRASLGEHLRKLPLGYITGRDPGDLANMLMGDFTLVETGVSHIVPQLFGALVMPVLAFVSLLFIDWRMSVAMFIALPVAVGILWLNTKTNQRMADRQMKFKLDAGNRLQEYLLGIRVMKAYNMVGEKFERLESSFRKQMKESIRYEALSGPVMLLTITLIRAGLTLMVLTGAYLLVGGSLDLLTFVMFLVIGSRVYDPLTSALMKFAELRYDERAGERILNLMKEPEMSGAQIPGDNTDIVFQNVFFAYGDKEVLHDVSLSMKQGTLTALVGPSGSGKSTVLKLCARFYDPSWGRVTFGGLDEAVLDPEKLMQKLSMVFQDVYLFQDTIGNNIRFGKENASEAEIMAAAKKACCLDFIMALPKGLETMVGEGGCTLSGGEKQRISIARAILKNAPVVLLDEATASLDPENELEVQKAIGELITGWTVIVIAHRLKTIRNADNIVVMEEGRVAEQGTHDELMSREGLYHKLWTIQAQAGGWSV
ncbi:ABC transporter ATP-binding protein [Desulfosporosinus sp. PR]|uniref:ABC transporter ATP-binding protein n=1 Tax=Candidatus Desulfosporosinus nitrosoreducens TaxID=3401928 RepID=UPI0027E92993|nr:ABC transporter ATP-binding protein [Desulfosporosinus sp. PR]MDQ7096490.1 ABC transporter ATP-binding protein [Desulfosporosinus sp. PR]